MPQKSNDSKNHSMYIIASSCVSVILCECDSCVSVINKILSSLFSVILYLVPQGIIIIIQTIQTSTLRVATGCGKMTSIDHLYLPVHEYLSPLCSNTLPESFN